MQETLNELLEKYYKNHWNNFYNEMDDHWTSENYQLKRKYDEIDKELEEQIIVFARKENAFQLFSKAIEDLDSEIFEILISELDSNSDKFDTLYDLYESHNNIHHSKVVFPDAALKMIKIVK